MAQTKIPLTQQGIKCLCQAPQWLRFGETTLCMRDDCLGAWVYNLSRKMAAAYYQCNIIKKRGNAHWFEFIQFFRGECWRKIMRGGPQIGAFDIADACKSFLRARHTSDALVPDQELTIPQDYSDQETDDLIQSTVDDLKDNWSGSPYTHVLADEIHELVADDIVSLYLSEQITIEDAALLMDVPITTAAAYMVMVVRETKGDIHG